MANTRKIEVVRVENTETGEQFSAGAPWFVDEAFKDPRDVVDDGVDSNRARIVAVGSTVKLDPKVLRMRTRLVRPESPLDKLTDKSRLRVTDVIQLERND